MRRPRSTCLPVLSLWCLATWCSASGLQAQDRKMALDSSGTVYLLQQGPYGELFPGGTAAHAESPVLALDVIPADGEAVRWPVPGTESSDVESSASLVFEKGTEKAYLLWQTSFNGVHPLFQLTSFDGTAFSEVIEIAYGPFLRKGSPKLAVTRETAADGSERTLLQLVWWEEAPGAISRKRYAPIFIESGGYAGTPPVIDLSSFLSGNGSAESGAALVATGLEDALALRAGKNDRSVVVGFLDPDAQRLATLEVELLPSAIDQLADVVRGFIVVVGAEARSRAELAASAHAKVLEVATEFHPATRGYLADQVREAVESSFVAMTPEGITILADVVRGFIVVVGSRIRAGGLESSGAAEILEIGPSQDGGYHHLKVSVVSERAAPEIGGPANLFLSESGRNVIVSWEGDGRIHYLESSGDGWSEPGVIELAGNLDRAAVFRMLSERVRTD